MDVSILTFQFAHNYGALLQAYALKKHLQNSGHNTKIAPYYPDWAQKEYTISPFAKGISIRKRISCLSVSKRKQLAGKFQSFQKEMLELDYSFETIKELEDYLAAFDVVGLEVIRFGMTE